MLRFLEVPRAVTVSPQSVATAVMGLSVLTSTLNHCKSEQQYSSEYSVVDSGTGRRLLNIPNETAAAKYTYT